MSRRKSQNNFERRLGVDRREYNYTNYFPERRLEKDRRKAISQKLEMAA